MNLKLKIRAGSLQFVLFIGTVIALLLMSFISLSGTQQVFGKKTELVIQTVKHAEFGLDYLLKIDFSQRDSIALPTTTDYPIELKGIKEFWGAFEKYSVVATSKKNRFVKSVLVGGKNNDQPALYLQNNQRPLIIVGNADITGGAILAEQGIRPGNIGGNSFYGKMPLQGSGGFSKASLPQLQTAWQTNLERLARVGSNEGPSTNLKMTQPPQFSNSFTAPTQYIYGESLDLRGAVLTGNIIIRASRRITVYPNSSLQDVILIAPEIIIKNKVVGTFQAIATKYITVEKNCVLSYPSALITIPDTRLQLGANAPMRPNILVDSKSEIGGLIMHLGSYEKQQLFPQIKIETNVSIHGEVYCEQNLELEGTVYGSVSTSAFMAVENGGIYQNHLFNGKINSTMLTEHYAGLLRNDPNTEKRICKWLY